MCAIRDESDTGNLELAARDGRCRPNLCQPVMNVDLRRRAHLPSEQRDLDSRDQVRLLEQNEYASFERTALHSKAELTAIEICPKFRNEGIPGVEHGLLPRRPRLSRNFAVNGAGHSLDEADEIGNLGVGEVCPLGGNPRIREEQSDGAIPKRSCGHECDTD